MNTCGECEAGFRIKPEAERYHCPICGDDFCSQICQTKHNQRMIEAARYVIEEERE